MMAKNEEIILHLAFLLFQLYIGRLSSAHQQKSREKVGVKIWKK